MVPQHIVYTRYKFLRPTFTIQIVPRQRRKNEKLVVGQGCIQDWSEWCGKQSAAVVGDVCALFPPYRIKASQKESYLRLFYVLPECDVLETQWVQTSRTLRDAEEKTRIKPCPCFDPYWLVK